MNPTTAILEEVPPRFRRSRNFLGSRRSRRRRRSSSSTNNQERRGKQQRHQQKQQHHQQQNRKRNHSAFHPETVDTFCFQCPALHCHVLVRVLNDGGVALCPIRSHRAFLYFAHEPLPSRTPPALPKLRRPSSKIQTMFQSWKHTLALSDDTSNSTNDDEEEDMPEELMDYNDHDQQLVHEKRRRKSNNSKDVTLSDILEEAHDLKNGWIQATTHCEVKEGRPDETTVLLQTNQSTLILLARSIHEKRMFLNVVRLLQQQGRSSNVSSTSSPSSSSRQPPTDPPATISRKNNHTSLSMHSIVESWQKRCRGEWLKIEQLKNSIHQSQSDILTWMQRMEKLDDSFKTLRDSLQEYLTIDQSSRRLLEHARGQLGKTVENYGSMTRRIHKLDTWLAANQDIVGATRLKLMMDRMDVKSNHRLWMYIAVLLAFLVLFCLQCIIF